MNSDLKSLLLRIRNYKGTIDGFGFSFPFCFKISSVVLYVKEYAQIKGIDITEKDVESLEDILNDFVNQNFYEFAKFAIRRLSDEHN